jgi:cytochrome c-type biogenesis protein CcmH/NrfG
MASLGSLRAADRERAAEGLRERRLRLERAGSFYERALASDPQQAEARLRLGRVRFRQGRMRAAREAFRDVLGGSRDADLQHLAHLFLGRVHEAEGELADAGQEYAQALTLAPQSQAAALALSHLRQRQGEPGSLELVEAALAQAGHRSAPDPYWDYLMARAAPRADALLDELRQQASR